MEKRNASVGTRNYISSLSGVAVVCRTRRGAYALAYVVMKAGFYLEAPA